MTDAGNPLNNKQNLQRTQDHRNKSERLTHLFIRLSVVCFVSPNAAIFWGCWVSGSGLGFRV